MATKAYYERLTGELSKHLPHYVITDAVKRARGHAAARARQIPDADYAEHIAFLGLSGDILRKASSRQVGTLHNRLHQLYGLEFSRLDKDEIQKAHHLLAEEMLLRKLAHEALDSLDSPELSKSYYPTISSRPDMEPEEVLKSDHAATHAWAADIMAGEDFPYSLEHVIRLHDQIAQELANRRIGHDTELEKSGWWDVIKARQFFTSPGGKHFMASRIVKMMPPHRVYVEPFAGGAAVFFTKEPSAVEVLNDKDPEIFNAYKTAQSISDEEIEKLAQMDWTIDRARLKALQKANPNDHIERLYKFLYLKGASYGGMGETFQTRREGQVFGVAKRIPQVRERLQKVRIHNDDAIRVIQKYDSPDTFFFVDPPYPAEWKGNMGVGYTNEQLEQLVKALQSVKGKFLLTVSSKERKYLPDEWDIRRIKSQRSLHIAPATRGGDLNAGHRADMEIIAANYDMAQKSQPDLGDVHVPGLLRSPRRIRKSADFEFIKSEDEKRLVWAVVMKPHYVDDERQWASPDEIMNTAHKFMLKGPKVYLEHMKDVSDQAKVVQSWILPEDLEVGDRTIPAGSWCIVLHILNDVLWQRVKSGLLKGVSIRGFSKVVAHSPPV